MIIIYTAALDISSIVVDVTVCDGRGITHIIYTAATICTSVCYLKPIQSSIGRYMETPDTVVSIHDGFVGLPVPLISLGLRAVKPAVDTNGLIDTDPA